MHKNSFVSLKVVLEGIRGPGIEGDIAIDDVTLEEGECRDPPPSEYRRFTPSLILSGSSGFVLSPDKVEIYERESNLRHLPALSCRLAGGRGGERCHDNGAVIT